MYIHITATTILFIPIQSIPISIYMIYISVSVYYHLIYTTKLPKSTSIYMAYAPPKLLPAGAATGTSAPDSRNFIQAAALALPP
mmetsp:Transcript_4612/g.4346  ORF Transcript_4612/g.4346 Transcript_4612/m.4346 type:complete len:84 (+) Transcript_4612:2-253(+)